MRRWDVYGIRIKSHFIRIHSIRNAMVWRGCVCFAFRWSGFIVVNTNLFMMFVNAQAWLVDTQNVLLIFSLLFFPTKLTLTRTHKASIKKNQPLSRIRKKLRGNWENRLGLTLALIHSIWSDLVGNNSFNFKRWAINHIYNRHACCLYHQKRRKNTFDMEIKKPYANKTKYYYQWQRCFRAIPLWHMENRI